MTIISAQTTVGELVRAFPARARIFEHLGIDYCCGGKKPLAEACRPRGLDPTAVVAMLAALERAPEEPEVDPAALTLTELCDHIEQVHHGYLRGELPRLDYMTRKVAAVHGDNEPRLLEIRRVFETFNARVASHTREEEATVFPAIRALEEKDGTTASSHLLAALEKLEHEHDEAGAALAQFKALTDAYSPPEWACNTFRALYDGLSQLEWDMHQHVHKENNVLFPRALSAV